MSGLLADLYSAGDRMKRKLGGLLNDPLGTIQLGSQRMAEDTNLLSRLASEAGYMPNTVNRADQSVLVSERQKALARALLADKGAEMGMAAATVWHGSPHKFDKFDSSKIGTGEGAQAYGHGLYLAESPKVAQTYKDLNPAGLSTPIRAFKGAELTPGSPEYHAATLVDGMGLQQARKQVAGWIANARPEMAREAAGWQKTLETLNAATSKADFKQLKNTGNMYKVDLPDNAIARMLDWDKPLSQQAPEVQATAKKIFDGMDKDAKRLVGDSLMSLKGKRLYELIASDDAVAGAGEFGAAASSLLRQNGIPGIRYLDGGSRGAGQGSSNYVIFPQNEGLLTILERNGVPIK